MENKTPHEEPNHPKHGVIMDMKNILAILAVICFTGSIFIDDRQFLFKAVAYGVMYIMLGFSYAIEHYHLFG